MNHRILNPTLQHPEAMQWAASEAAHESGYEDEFVRLAALQKIVLVAVASGQKEMFSQSLAEGRGQRADGGPCPRR